MLLRINSTDTAKYRNDAHFKFFQDFVDLVNRHGAEALKIKPLFDRLVLLLNQEDEAIKKILKSATTKHIMELDRRRDDIWNGFVGVIKYNQKHFDPIISESARKVTIVIDTYGNIDKKSYIEQTSATYNILQDFQRLAADLAIIPGANAWVVEIRNLNATFDNLMKDRNDEEAARCTYELKSIRAAIDEIYRGARSCINSYVLVDGTEPYEVFIKTWNVNVAKYNALIKNKRRNSLNPDSPDSPDLQDGGTDDTDDGTDEVEELGT